MIKIYLIGGLGNQLFQFSLAQTLMRKYNTEKVVFITNLVDIDKKREIRLNELFSEDFSFVRVSNLILLFHKILSKLNSRFLNKIFRFSTEKEGKQFLAPFKNRYNNYYLGYWQNLDINNVNLLKELVDINVMKSQLDANAKIILQDIISQESVCVHVRRGDYLSNEKMINTYSLCGENYYDSSIQKMSQKLKNPKYFFFSDDVGWIQEKYNSFNNSRIVQCNTDIMEFVLMFFCKNYIIPNSTFSLWAVYLSQSKDKQVIVPEKWFISRDVNLYYDEWLRIPVDKA